MIEISELIALPRTLFALKALYHFLFIPLTFGLVALIIIMEIFYALTKSKAWSYVSKFLGILFVIHLVASTVMNVQIESQFEKNWQKYTDQGEYNPLMP